MKLICNAGFGNQRQRDHKFMIESNFIFFPLFHLFPMPFFLSLLYLFFPLHLSLVGKYMKTSSKTCLYLSMNLLKKCGCFLQNMHNHSFVSLISSVFPFPTIPRKVSFEATQLIGCKNFLIQTVSPEVFYAHLQTGNMEAVMRRGLWSPALCLSSCLPLFLRGLISSITVWLLPSGFLRLLSVFGPNLPWKNIRRGQLH